VRSRIDELVAGPERTYEEVRFFGGALNRQTRKVRLPLPAYYAAPVLMCGDVVDAASAVEPTTDLSRTDRYVLKVNRFTHERAYFHEPPTSSMLRKSTNRGESAQ
jgi:hypothetical protein